MGLELNMMIRSTRRICKQCMTISLGIGFKNGLTMLGY